MRTLFLIFALVSAMAQAQLPSGLIAHWQLDGNIVEQTSGTLPGIIKGSVQPVMDKFGNPCGAMRFSNGGYIEVPNSPIFDQLTTAISICAWAKIDSSADNFWFTILCKGEATESANSPHFRFQFTKLTIALTNLVPTWQILYEKGVWYHWAVTFDGSTLNVYMDGINIGSFNYPVQLRSNTFPLEIGRDVTGNTESFNGCLDELMIFNKALSSTEIRSIFNTVPKVNCGGQQCPLPDLVDGIKVQWSPQPVVVKSKMLRLFAEAATESAHRQIGINFNGINWRNAYLPKNRTCVYDVQLNKRCNYIVFKSLQEMAVFKADIDGTALTPTFQETDVNLYRGVQIIYEP